ncbi:MAG: trimethylamine methyltransferase family protein [Phycisphaerae bacterium]
MEPIRILAPRDLEMIGQAALTILEQTGMVFQSEEALDYLKKFGCQVDHGTFRVKFPHTITQQVIRKMKSDFLKPDRPDRMPVRFSHVRFQSLQHQVHEDFTVSAGGFCCFIHDLEGNRRPANHDDVLCAINMVNHLDQIATTGLPVSDQTIPAVHRPVIMASELAKYTQKIGGIETFRKEDVRSIYEIAQVVAGSKENFQKHPALVGYAEVRSPLCFDRNMIDIFMEYIKLGVPQTVDTMPAGGSTAPMTAAGILALGAAETIAPMVLAYAIRDDATVAMDVTPSYTDMSSGLYKYSGADRCNLLMARIQLFAEYYGCPPSVHGGKTDSCFYNEQTGAEKMASMLLPILAGAVGIGTVGHIENAVTFSPMQLVIDNEIARFVRRAIRKSILVNSDTLATSVIDSVGPGGNFLNEEHTLEHFREELLLSPLFPSQPWQQAHTAPQLYDTAKKAKALARELWQKPTHMVLSDPQVREIDAIVRRATGK